MKFTYITFNVITVEAEDERRAYWRVEEKANDIESHRTVLIGTDGAPNEADITRLGAEFKAEAVGAWVDDLDDEDES